MTDEEFSRGEIRRALERLEKGLGDLTTEVRDRHHELADQVNAAIGPISTLKVQMQSAETNLVRLDGEVRNVAKDANRIAGAGAVLAILAGLMPWPWRH